ncbi:hypothetical protein A2774_01075 [Candidatus Roizmanbacteria bacterium RIFCSPHIGHO2_01_FULL_39_12c]|uniref:Disease resistance R13L4/SHOC-2-like LRR domain-containing protein n=1 Tax=Candidatus Roizmanbacteria bacterium RIFCSPHIGHO2_01_FULL_39_12c TaxID=1802031 RepID=A0A1F7G815_9BACT|nr:MAG: hypothetical protein A2774_01075 [Candidatus Roizmanbacteria bacterium RIFCSPHIGHO2_01_FULL_39_12c]OGK46422.1 MAG: hypothetical protein A2963_01485 [Candidatus Roizmanbacteria bacterium RIFCSPLOWO2_01_FULL_40_13]
MKFKLQWIHFLFLFYVIAFGGVAWHTYQVERHIEEFQSPEENLREPLKESPREPTIDPALSREEDVSCHKEGRRYPIDVALADPAACDVEITKVEDLNKLKKNSKKLRHVRSIFFRDSPVTKVPPQISDLNNLRTLYFLESLNTYLPKEIGNLENLTSLNFNQADIQIIPKEIIRLKKLNTLSITGNAGLVELPDVSKLTGLKVLFLAYNSGLVFSNEYSDNLSIEEVDLSKSNLNEVPAFLSKLKNLKLLNLSENIMDPAEIAKIKQSLPSTNVVYSMAFLDGL